MKIYKPQNAPGIIGFTVFNKGLRTSCPKRVIKPIVLRINSSAIAQKQLKRVNRRGLGKRVAHGVRVGHPSRHPSRHPPGQAFGANIEGYVVDYLEIVGAGLQVEKREGAGEVKGEAIIDTRGVQVLPLLGEVYGGIELDASDQLIRSVKKLYKKLLSIEKETPEHLSEVLRNKYQLSINQLANATDIPKQTLSRSDRLKGNNKAFNKLRDMQHILNRVEDWSGGHYHAYAWFMSTIIPGFGDMTPCQVFKEENGPEALNDYLDDIALGGYA